MMHVLIKSPIRKIFKQNYFNGKTDFSAYRYSGHQSIKYFISKILVHRKLGLTVVYEDDDIPLLVLNGCGQTSLTLLQSESELTGNKNCTYYVIFKSDSSIDTREELIRRGVNVGELLSDGICASFIFKDFEGRIFEVRQTYSEGAPKRPPTCL